MNTGIPLDSMHFKPNFQSFILYNHGKNLSSAPCVLDNIQRLGSQTVPNDTMQGTEATYREPGLKFSKILTVKL